MLYEGWANTIYYYNSLRVIFCFAFTLFNNEICYRLPIKIYIDSRPKTEESASHTD